MLETVRAKQVLGCGFLFTALKKPAVRKTFHFHEICKFRGTYEPSILQVSINYPTVGATKDVTFVRGERFLKECLVVR